MSLSIEGGLGDDVGPLTLHTPYGDMDTHDGEGRVVGLTFTGHYDAELNIMEGEGLVYDWDVEGGERGFGDHGTSNFMD